MYKEVTDINKIPSTTLLRKAVFYSERAYTDKIFQGQMISNKLTSATAHFIQDNDLDLDVLAFRGTQQVRDWFFNCSALPVRYCGRWVHGGFALAHKSIWKKCEKYLNPGRRLLITGHSLGGAMAELSALKLKKYYGKKKASLITFGKPNVFWKKKNRYKMDHLEEHFSVVSGSDVVARIPRYFYCPDDGQMIFYLSNHGDDYLNCDREFMAEDWGIVDAISDHSMSMYDKRLRGHIFGVPEIEEAEH
tara:strand:- start:235 stop:978 length:744 start_codon:yes stop_codon:yes gene_type:complete